MKKLDPNGFRTVLFGSVFATITFSSFGLVDFLRLHFQNSGRQREKPVDECTRGLKGILKKKAGFTLLILKFMLGRLVQKIGKCGRSQYTNGTSLACLCIKLGEKKPQQYLTVAV